MNAQTTARVITPRGRGAVATVTLDGDCGVLDDVPLFSAANGRPLCEQPLDRIVFGRWGSAPGEDVVLCRTGDATVEIHCHGGEAAVKRILSDLEQAGCRTVSWHDAEIRPQRLDEECSETFVRATTLRTAAILLDQVRGSLRRECDALLLTEWNSESRESMRLRLDDLLHWADFGLHLTQTWNVVLAGRPNVGKSSLINALVGYARSIVHNRPGTTRDVVTAETALEGWPMRFADTAGIREHAESIESEGILLARKQMADADCRLLILDRGSPPTAADLKLLSDWPDALIVANKSDLPDAWDSQLPANCLLVSAKKAEGIEALSKAIVARLVPVVPPVGVAIPSTERQISLLKQARESLKSDDRAGMRRSIEELIG